MAEFRKRQKIRNFFHSKPVLILLFIIIVVFAINIAGIAKKSAEVKRNRDNARAKVAELAEKETKLQTDIASLETKAGTEDAIRDKFRAVKEGEGLIVITDPVLPVDTVTTEKSHGIWAFFRNIFR